MLNEYATRTKITSNQVARLAKVLPDSDELLITISAYCTSPEERVYCAICGKSDRDENIYEWMTQSGDLVYDIEPECATCVAKAANDAVFTTYFLKIN